MSNVLDPATEFDPASFLLNQQQRAMASAVTSLEDDPKKAARAAQLSEATGVNPALVYGNLENFEQQHRASLTAQLLSNNQYLREFVNTYPLASAISNDDYGQLDSVSESLRVFGKSAARSAAPAIGSLPFMGAGATLGAGIGAPLGPVGAFAGAVTGGLVGGFGGGYALGQLQEWVLSQLPKEWLESVGQDPKTMATERKTNPTASFLGGMAPFALAMRPGATSITERGVSAGFNVGLEIAQELVTEGHVNWEHVAYAGAFGAAFARANVAGAKLIHSGDELARKLAPWVTAGVEPPVGIHPLVDQIKIKQSEVDLSNLDESFKRALASKTRERNTEIFAGFIRLHPEAKIEISAEAVAKLYGDTPPTLDDGKLGWVPRIQEQIETAIASGSGIEIPLADWIAKADPKVAKELHDDIRVRPGGVTKNEAKELTAIHAALEVEEARPGESAPTPVQAVRQAANLEEPLLTKEKKLTLKRAEGIDPERQKLLDEDTTHAFTLQDPLGKTVAELYIAEELGGKRLYVDDIRGLEGKGPNDLGPRAMRDILAQIKAEFPKAETLEGYRVSGARDKSGSWEKGGKVSIKLDQPDTVDLAAFLEGTWEEWGAGTHALVKPTELYTANEKAIIEAVNRELARIVPKQVEAFEAHRIESEGRSVRGAHIMYKERQPVILWSFESLDAVGTARHEAIHHLRQQGFFTKEEWATLMAEAIEKDWLVKHRINERYSNLKQSAKLEEAIAEEFSKWRRAPEKETAIGRIFAKLLDLLESIKGAVRKILGKEPTVEDLFRKVDSGEVGSREGNAPRVEGSFKAQQGELDVTRMEDRDAFARASAIGMTVDQYKRYMALIEKRQKEDIEAFAGKALAEQKKRQTVEWKENEKVVRAEIEAGITDRPDIAADRLLSDGVLYGEKLASRPKLAADALTAEQRAALPKEYYAENGIHPDDLAGLLGYPSGAGLLDNLTRLTAERTAAGMTPKAHLTRLIDIETDHQMSIRYGELSKNILEEAKDQVLSETQLDLLHEEVLALGLQAKAEFSITKEQLKAWVVESLNKSPLDAVSTDKYLASAGRAGKTAEMALLKGEAAEAFRLKQQQYIAVTMATEAKKVEKLQEQFVRRAKRFSKREVTGFEQEYTNFVHQLLQEAMGTQVVRRTSQDVTDSIAKDGNTTLDAFVETKQADGWELDVADAIRQGQVKPIDQMTVAEFRDFKDAVDSLAHVGRQVKLIEVAGKKMDFALWKEEVLANIQTLPKRAKDKQGKLLYNWDASLTRMEEIVKDLDLRRELGPLFNAMIRPMMDAKHKEYLLQEALSKELASIKTHGKAWQKTLGDTIPNDFFLDPDGTPFDLTREHMINIMLNFGNRSNIDKFTRGWVGKDNAPMFEARMRDLINRHATKEDWDFVQRMGDIFEGWRKETDTLYHNLSGLAPKWIKIEPVQTPHGEYRGWYFPIIWDKYWSNVEVIKESDVLGPNYFKATTANRHTKERTGYVDRVEFQNSIEQVASRMQQMMHDISYRAAVMDVRKIIGDRQIRDAIRKHYGSEYEAQLDPWLKDIANHFNQNEKANSAMNNALHRARFALSAHALGLNLKVIGSPDVGSLNPAAVAHVLSNYTASVDLAWAKSKEIPHTYRNMDRDFRERLEQTIVKNGWDNVQATAVRWAFIPLVKVSQGFRIVTFVDQYKKALARGLNDADASALADSQVRLRHGSTGIPDLPAIMRGSEGMKMATMFYGFFNAMSNWQRQIPGNLRRGEYKNTLEATYGAVLIPAIFGALLFNKPEKDEPWWKTIGKALSLQLLGTVPLVRDLGSTMIEGFKPSTPIGSLFQAMASAYTDGKHYLQNKEVKKPITHAANVVGLGLGLPLAQIGRTGQFAYDVNQGKQRPKNIIEWYHGVLHGEAVPKR